MEEKARPAASFVPPTAMSDHLWPDSYTRKKISAEILELFLQFGYEFISTPIFEYAEVLEDGSSSVDKQDQFRFVEPETGQVAVLRPDITPQIARIVSTQLLAKPAPWKLCYEGNVFRKNTNRSRRRRQSLQVGIEHMGTSSAEIDASVILLAVKACQASGLKDFKIEIGHAAIVKQVLANIPSAVRSQFNQALLHKDTASIEQLAKQSDLDTGVSSKLISLCELHGDFSILDKAKSCFSEPTFDKPLKELESLVQQLKQAGMEDSLLFDLGETRGQSYYTGIQFQILADGPGAPIGTGGRYDKLLERFGMNEPAIGFAIDIDDLVWSIQKSQTHKKENHHSSNRIRILFAEHGHVNERGMLEDLRGETLFTNNIRASFDDGKNYGRAWSFHWLLAVETEKIQLFEFQTNKLSSFPLDQIDRVIAKINQSEI